MLVVFQLLLSGCLASGLEYLNSDVLDTIYKEISIKSAVATANLYFSSKQVASSMDGFRIGPFMKIADNYKPLESRLCSLLSDQTAKQVREMYLTQSVYLECRDYLKAYSQLSVLHVHSDTPVFFERQYDLYKLLLEDKKKFNLTDIEAFSYGNPIVISAMYGLILESKIIDLLSENVNVTRQGLTGQKPLSSRIVLHHPTALLKLLQKLKEYYKPLEKSDLLVEVDSNLKVDFNILIRNGMEVYSHFISREAERNPKVSNLVQLYNRVFNLFNRYETREAIELIKSHNLDPNFIYHGHTPLGQTIQKQDFESMKYLLTIGANPNDCSGFTYCPLVLAAQTNKPEFVKELLKAGAFVDQKDSISGNTALIIAAESGSSSIVETLVNNGASVNQMNEYGMLPLTAAIRSGNMQGIQVLLEYGASLKTRHFWIKASNPLRTALNLNNMFALRLLLSTNEPDIYLEVSKALIHAVNINSVEGVSILHTWIKSNT